MFINLPESRTILSQGVQDGICDVGTARHAQRLQTVTTPANGDESLICDLLLTQRQSARLWGRCGKTDITSLCSWPLALHNRARPRVKLKEVRQEGVGTSVVQGDIKMWGQWYSFRNSIFSQEYLRAEIWLKREELNDTHVDGITPQALNFKIKFNDWILWCPPLFFWSKFLRLSPGLQLLFERGHRPVKSKFFTFCFSSWGIIKG